MPTAGTKIFINSPLSQQGKRYKDQKNITLIKCLTQIKPGKSKIDKARLWDILPRCFKNVSVMKDGGGGEPPQIRGPLKTKGDFRDTTTKRNMQFLTGGKMYKRDFCGKILTRTAY